MATKPKKFEDELKDLEAIVNQIDSGELSLEESIGAFERGVTLVKTLNQKLDEIERKVEVLTRTATGALQTEPLDGDDDTPPNRRGRSGKGEDEPPF
jgi:exodeoxyribonuclease VII small subunit